MPNQALTCLICFVFGGLGQVSDHAPKYLMQAYERRIYILCIGGVHCLDAHPGGAAQLAVGRELLRLPAADSHAHLWHHRHRLSPPGCGWS